MRGGGVAGSQLLSTAHSSPNKIRVSNSIFNLCLTPFVSSRREYTVHYFAAVFFGPFSPERSKDDGDGRMVVILAVCCKGGRRVGAKYENSL